VINGSITVYRRVRGFHKGSEEVRGIEGGCSKSRGSRFKEVKNKGFCKGLYLRL
jgi:hypothetical protein